MRWFGNGFHDHRPYLDILTVFLTLLIDQLATATDIEKEELEKQLGDMANKGLVIDVLRNGTTYYNLSPLVIGLFARTGGIVRS